MVKHNRGGKPRLTAASKQPLRESPSSPRDYDRTNPKYCLKYLCKDFGLDQLDQAARAAFAGALHRRAAFTWAELLLNGRHPAWL